MCSRPWRGASPDGCRHSASDDDSGCAVDEYSWVPSGIRPEMVHAYFSALPSDRVPFVASPGAKWRLRQLRHQLPAHDSDPSYCGHLKAEEREQLNEFDRTRMDKCLGRGLVQTIPYGSPAIECAQCSLLLEEGSVGVWAEQVRAWAHPACFVCRACKELLVDLIYYKYENDIFCGRHHAEKFLPRCARCDELIFSRECAEAEGQSWHVEHFLCTLCSTELGGQRYFRSAEGRIVCKPCKKRDDAGRCGSCRVPLRTDEAVVSQNGQSWHASPSCFKCSTCARALLGSPFTAQGTSLVCSPSCPRPSHSCEHIYETVIPETVFQRSPRKLHPSQSERCTNDYSLTPVPLGRPPTYSSSSSDDSDCEYPPPSSLPPKKQPLSSKKSSVRGNYFAKRRSEGRCIVS